jgi:hypothetical protein
MNGQHLFEPWLVDGVPQGGYAPPQARDGSSQIPFSRESVTIVYRTMFALS